MAPPRTQALSRAPLSSWSAHSQTPWGRSQASPSSRSALEHWVGPEWVSGQTLGAGCDCTPRLHLAPGSAQCRNQFYYASVEHCYCCCLRLHGCEVCEHLMCRGRPGHRGSCDIHWCGAGRGRGQCPEVGHRRCWARARGLDKGDLRASDAPSRQHCTSGSDVRQWSRSQARYQCLRARKEAENVISAAEKES